MNTILKSFGMLALAAALSTNVSAQDRGRSATMNANNEMGNEKDSKHVSDIMSTNGYLLTIMEMAQTKSQHEGLKMAVNHMIDDHRKMSQQAREYADAHGYMKAADKGEKFAEKKGKWEKKRAGQEWDADIVEELVDGHKDAIDQLQDIKGDAKDEELKMWAANNLPVLQAHLEELTPLKEKVKKPWKDGHKAAKTGDK